MLIHSIHTKQDFHPHSSSDWRADEETCNRRKPAVVEACSRRWLVDPVWSTKSDPTVGKNPGIGLLYKDFYFSIKSFIGYWRYAACIGSLTTIIFRDSILFNVEGKALMSVALTYQCWFIASTLNRIFTHTLLIEEQMKKPAIVENLQSSKPAVVNDWWILYDPQSQAQLWERTQRIDLFNKVFYFSIKSFISNGIAHQFGGIQPG